jgi:WD40 repeat protein
MKNLLVLFAIAAMLAPPLRGQEIIFGWNKVNESGHIFDMEFMPDNDYFVLVTATDLQIRESETGELVNTYPFGGSEIEFTPDSSRILMIPSGGTTGRLQLRDASDLSLINEYTIPEDPEADALFFSEMVVDPVRPFLYTIWKRMKIITGKQHYIMKIHIYNYETMEYVGKLTTDKEESLPLMKLAISNDGKYLAISNELASYIHVWDLETHQKERSYKICDNYISGYGGVPYCMKFSEINTENIYLSGMFPKSKDEYRFNGLLKYNIHNNNIIDSTFAINPQKMGEGFFVTFDEEKRIMASPSGFIEVLNFIEKIIEVKINIQAVDYKRRWSSKIIYSKNNEVFIGSNNEYFSSGYYEIDASNHENPSDDFTLYPNPTNGLVILEKSCLNINQFYSIYDINGIELLSNITI